LRVVSTVSSTEVKNISFAAVLFGKVMFTNLTLIVIFIRVSTTVCVVVYTVIVVSVPGSNEGRAEGTSLGCGEMVGTRDGDVVGAALEVPEGDKLSRFDGVLETLGNRLGILDAN